MCSGRKASSSSSGAIQLPRARRTASLNGGTPATRQRRQRIGRVRPAICEVAVAQSVRHRSSLPPRAPLGRGIAHHHDLEMLVALREDRRNRALTQQLGGCRTSGSPRIRAARIPENRARYPSLTRRSRRRSRCSVSRSQIARTISRSRTLSPCCAVSAASSCSRRPSIPATWSRPASSARRLRFDFTAQRLDLRRECFSGRRPRTDRVSPTAWRSSAALTEGTCRIRGSSPPHAEGH